MTASDPALLDGLRVVDASGEPAALAGRILADLGAAVVRVGDPGGPSEGAEPDRWQREAWDRGVERVAAPSPSRLRDLLGAAHIVIETPGWPGCLTLDPAAGPSAVWVRVTPFGLTGPRCGWRASDLGAMASSGNMHATGDPDRPPVRPTAPAAYAHAGPEIVFAALTGLATGGPQHVDVSMQELMLVANMCAPARFAATGVGFRRRGANIGRTREIWPTKDGWVSFGIRGGKARVPSLETLTRLCAEDGVATPALTERDWSGFSHTEASAAELAAISEPVGEFFARHTMQELYEIACETNLMLAPINSPREIYASAQLAARDFFAPDGEGRPRTPRTFVHARFPAENSGPASVPGTEGARGRDVRFQEQGRGAWAGVRIVEFGSGAAGPVASRYFVEHGATVVRVESASRPDFLRVYALGPDNPHGLEGSHLFDGLNAGKLSVTLNLKHPEGVAVARRLVGWADAVCENFAPRAMKGFGLDYDSLAAAYPDLVMISACLNGQTGPHKDYPGFGGQGAALSGWNFLTGWPDREPVGPFGTITDSMAPRFVAAALAAALLHRRATGRGVYLDLSQVESAIYALTPWLLRYHATGETLERDGNRSERAVPHGAFPCRGDDRWVAIACWSDDEWARLARAIGVDDQSLNTLADRRSRIEEVEKAVAAWTADRDALEITEHLQALGIEAVPVQDFADLLDDPQLAHREHFQWLVHPVMGRQPYERNGFRLSEAASGYPTSSPTLGRHSDYVLSGLLDLPRGEIERLRASGALD